MAVALSTGLYATHTLVPPTPGPIAAAGNVGADLGLVIIVGLIVAIPAALVGLWWANRVGKNIIIEGTENQMSYDELQKTVQKTAYVWLSLCPHRSAHTSHRLVLRSQLYKVHRIWQRFYWVLRYSSKTHSW